MEFPTSIWLPVWEKNILLNCSSKSFSHLKLTDCAREIGVPKAVTKKLMLSTITIIKIDKSFIFALPALKLDRSHSTNNLKMELSICFSLEIGV